MGSADKRSNFSYYAREQDLPVNTDYTQNVIEVEEQYGKPIRGASLTLTGTPQVRVRFNSLGPNSPFYTIYNGMPFDMQREDLEIRRIFISNEDVYLYDYYNYGVPYGVPYGGDPAEPDDVPGNTAGRISVIGWP